MKKSLVLLAALVLSFGAVANAAGIDNPGGSLALSGTVEGSISITILAITTTGITLGSGDGTSAATANPVTAAMYGTSDTLNGFTKTLNGVTDFKLTGTYNVIVEQANTGMTSFNLGAKLQSAPTAEYVWTLNTVALNSSTVSTVDTEATFHTPQLQTLVITVPASASAGASALNNTILYTVNVT